MRQKLNARYLISLCLSLLGVGTTWLGTTTSRVLQWLGIGMIAVSVIFAWTIRCPNCGYILTGKRHLFLPKFCPECGTPISDKETEE